MISSRISKCRQSMTASALACVLVLGGCAVDAGAQPAQDRVIYGVRLGYDREKLSTESEAVAIVQVTATEDRINNLANTLRNSDEDLIHHFSSVAIVEALRGPAVEEIVQTGGQVGDFRVTFGEDGAGQLLKPGSEYLVFLTDWLWPIGNQLVPGYGITGGPAGLFIQKGDVWVNGDGLTLSVADVEELLADVPNDPDAGKAIAPSEVEGLTQGD